MKRLESGKHRGEMSLSKEEFDEAGNLVGFWIFRATELLNAAEFLNKNDFTKLSAQEQDSLSERESNQRHFVDTAQMLKGMAIETFLKACLIKKGKIITYDGKMLGNMYNKHNLEKMAEDADIELTVGERAVLKNFSGRIVLGRYPILKKFEQYKNFPKVPNVKVRDKKGQMIETRGLFWSEEQEKTVKQILEKICSALNAK